MQDHPRVCGEKRCAPQIASGSGGSPPRVRGKAGCHVFVLLVCRITPACAGKRPLRSAPACRSGDHPRVCGEKRLRLHISMPMLGSPPRVRGKVSHDCGTCPRARITPACAGKSGYRDPARGEGQDHPRVCGEKGFTSRSKRPCQGSPPRVRGKAGCHVFVLLVCRITPACAGKSSFRDEVKSNGRDHPRVCGEKWQRRNWSQRLAGSPPRVRGKALVSHMCSGRLRITPACAGKRLKKALKNKDF